MIEVISFTLVGLIVFQQIYFMRQIQKLVDKLMSKSFAEYKQAEKPAIVKKRQENLLPEYMKEDMGPLSEFQTI